MRTLLTLVAATLAMLITALPANAKIKKHHHRIPVERIHIDAPINMAMTLSARRHYRHHGKQVYADPNWQPHLQPQPELMSVQSREGHYRISHLRHSRGVRSIYGSRYTPSQYSERADVGGRPSGCPRAFCGCALALKVFGRIVPTLNLASNWRQFPRDHAAPGNVAVWHHHVALIQSVSANASAIVWDPNGGRGRTWVHIRSLAGATIVNPHGGQRYADAG